MSNDKESKEEQVDEEREKAKQTRLAEVNNERNSTRLAEFDQPESKFPR
jgi:hypothetical protein